MSVIRAHSKVYFTIISFIFAVVVVVNLFSEIRILSFQNFLMLALPIWFTTLLFYLFRKKYLEKNFTAFIKKNYPEELQQLYSEKVDYLEPDTERHIFHLFLRPEFVKIPDIAMFKKEVDKITFLLVMVTVLSMMSFLLSTVFILGQQG